MTAAAAVQKETISSGVTRQATSFVDSALPRDDLASLRRVIKLLVVVKGI